MKEITIQDAQGQLGRLVAEACRGEVIVLTDGDKHVTLSPYAELDLEMDSPELEAELMKAANSPVAPLREGELEEIANRSVQAHRAKQKA